MSEPRHVAANDFDFEHAPLFRKTATLSTENVRIAEKREVITTRHPKRGGGEFVETTNTAEPGHYIVTRLKHDQQIIPPDQFAILYEIDPINSARYISKNWGRAIRVDQDVSFMAQSGRQQHIMAGGVIFQSGPTGEIYGNQKETFEADFARQAKDGGLMPLSTPLVMQEVWAMRKREPAHIKDIAGRIAIRIASRARRYHR
jgi:hypothetical protein